jgi:hypothetical protein
MANVIIQINPKVQDYSRAMRAYLARNKSYWVGLAVVPISCVIFLVVSYMNIWVIEGYIRFLINALVIILLLAESSPLWTSWLVARNSSKNRFTTLPATYNIDDEKLMIAHSEAESKYSWSVFSKAFENKEYFFLTYSTNKNAFQFIPKRALVSAEQEQLTRDLITAHLGEIVDIQKGFTGWRLTALTVILFSLLMLCTITVSAVFAILT